MNSDKIRGAGDFYNKVVDYFYPVDEAPRSFSLPWHKTRRIFFPPKALSIWSGFNGHGKSMFLGQVALSAITAGEKCLIASFEMAPEKTLARMIRQATSIYSPDEHMIEACFRWLHEILFVYDKLGTPNLERMIRLFTEAIDKREVRHIFIDSLMKCGLNVDDLNAQKRLVDTLQNFAQSNPVHIHLVAHSRKDRDETQVPGKMDIKGAGEISDMADNVFIIWRNKPKENSIAEGRTDKQNEYDAVFKCDKSRDEGENEQSYGLYYHRGSMQYLESASESPIRYFQY